jgi:hypothetical protein
MSEQTDLYMALKESVKWARKAGTLEGIIDSVIWRLTCGEFNDEKARDLAAQLSNTLAEIQQC